MSPSQAAHFNAAAVTPGNNTCDATIGKYRSEQEEKAPTDSEKGPDDRDAIDHVDRSDSDAQHEEDCSAKYGYRRGYAGDSGLGNTTVGCVGSVHMPVILCICLGHLLNACSVWHQRALCGPGTLP